MRRPLPPELIDLGDQLEGAVRRTIGLRRTRRQMFLNAATGMLVALPLLPAVLGTMAQPITIDAPVPRQSAPGFGGGQDDFPPRALRGPGSPSEDVLAEPTTLRRALR